MKKTTFYSCHEKLGAKIVDFAGYAMPVQYHSIRAEHLAVRNTVGLFDVSHMGEVLIRGEQALAFVQHITTNNAAKLDPGKVQYSAMCYEDGGIVDDLLVYRLTENEFMLVVNASNREKDVAWMKENNTMGAEIADESDDYSLLALQGRHSRAILEKIFDVDLSIPFYTFVQHTVDGIDYIISRTGYTGELGFEIYFKGSEEQAVALWDAIMKTGEPHGIEPAGLGARDSLRLEMGYCLYGNDIDQTTNPLEAGLGWITKLKKDEFVGQEALKKLKTEGLKRRLCPVQTGEKAFPRKGYEIAADGKTIGVITSGTVSPVLDKAIALAYLDKEYAVEGRQVQIVIRKREIPAEVVKLPFVETGQ